MHRFLVRATTIAAAVAALGLIVLNPARADAATIYWSPWKTCAISGHIDYQVRTGWYRSGSTSVYDYTQFALAGSIGFKPPLVAHIHGDQKSNGSYAGQAEVYMTPTTYQAIQFPGTMRYIPNAGSYAHTVLMDSRDFFICQVFTSAP